MRLDVTDVAIRFAFILALVAIILGGLTLSRSRLRDVKGGEMDDLAERVRVLEEKVEKLQRLEKAEGKR